MTKGDDYAGGPQGAFGILEERLESAKTGHGIGAVAEDEPAWSSIVVPAPETAQTSKLTAISFCATDGYPRNYRFRTSFSFARLLRSASMMLMTLPG